MTADEQSSVGSRRPFNLSPWLVVLGAIIVYIVTLQHWVTLTDLPLVSKITGWDWHPGPLEWRQTPVAPLFLLLTVPIRIFPVAWQPALLNLFTAVCASLTLGLLAASVRLFPHDRTREQRQRESGAYALLSIRGAFLPPLFAVLMMGLQLTFWRNAIDCTGEMLNLLVFAFLIYSLLRYRVSQSDNWLYIFALVYGLGTTNNWALIGYFPLFLIAMAWIKGEAFFSLGFLGRMAGCGLVGLALYLVIPAVSSLSSDRANFFTVLHWEVGMQSFGLLRTVPRWVGILAVPTLLPLAFAGIKWPSFEGDISAAGSGMTKLMFRVLHVVFLLLALVMFFDFRYSPSLRLDQFPIPFLTFYYMGALCIGYYSGYILLVYSKSGPAWDRRGPVLKIINITMVIALCALAVAATCARLVKSLPHINAAHNEAAYQFSQEMINDLPPKPVIILADDPVRQYLLEAAFRREGKVNNNIMIDTGSLAHREYITNLFEHYPALEKASPAITQFPSVMDAQSMVRYLYILTQKYPVYYVQPSFGYFFEVFYLKPHGLTYQIEAFPDKSSDPPPLITAQEYSENQAVWKRLEKTVFPGLPDKAKLDPNVSSIADNYAVGLDVWGVDLQKAGYLPDAHSAFDESVQLHPQNFIAKINREYNEHLQKGDRRAINTEDLIFKAIQLYHGLVPILKYNGPPDEPGINAQIAQQMAISHDYRQAEILLLRCLQLLPNDPGAQLDLAKTYVDWGFPERAFPVLAKLHANQAIKPWDVTRVEALAYLGKKDFPTAEKLLINGYKQAPSDPDHVKTLAEFYRVTAYDILRQSNLAARQAQLATLHTNAAGAKQDMAIAAKLASQAGMRFTNALYYINQDLQALAAANHESSTPYGAPEMQMQKAEVQMMLKDYKGSAATLSQILDEQPKNATAVLNRAIAETELKDFAAAKEDYKTLRRLNPSQNYVVDYGLADIASRQKQTNEEIRYLKRYLTSAPDGTMEYAQVKKRLGELQNH